MDMENKRTNKKIQLRLGELFCGPGGLALGAISSKVNKGETSYSIKHAWATDYDHDSCSTYCSNICPNNPESVICCNVENLDLNALESIDILSFGFPCNDFSIVGEKKGINGKFGALYLFGVKALNSHKPKVFVAENVGGLKNANNSRVFKKIIQDLASSGNGYNLSVHLYKFEEYGVPQIRHRIFIVGFDKTTDLVFRVPGPLTNGTYMSAKDAIENPPIQNNYANHEFTKQSDTVIERLRHTKPWENAWTANLPSHLKLNVKGARLSQIYRRLHPDKPSYTITGSGGGGTHGYHWDEPRALTNRERARIQTFPDNFIFRGSKESVRKQIGMSVSPKMSQIIFSCILKTFAGVKYQFLPDNCSFLEEIQQISLFQNDM